MVNIALAQEPYAALQHPPPKCGPFIAHDLQEIVIMIAYVAIHAIGITNQSSHHKVSIFITLSSTLDHGQTNYSSSGCSP